MWTAKRVLILMGGLLVTLSCFAIYTLVFGAIDGLPPFPADWLPGNSTAIIELQGPGIANEKLEMAFGAGVQELRRPYRLWLPEKGVAFAAGQFDIEPPEEGGRVRLAPFSVAIFQKPKIPNGFPEISTIKCDIAFLTLDRPVSQMSELSNRKVIKVQLQGRQPGITITNNRHTPEKNDDVDILITNGDLIYEERRNVIWTDGVVRLKDYQSKPPMTVDGKGLEMLLAKDSSPNRQRNAKVQANASNDNGGIERIILRQDVVMNFWVDGGSGFLTGSHDNKKPKAPVQEPADTGSKPAPEKAQIHIRTEGTFVYDLTKEFAWFESPPPHDAKNPKSDDEQIAPGQVHVARVQTADGKEKIDQLTCDRLDLQFRKKAEGLAAAPANSTDGGREIETALATARTGNEVVLALDSEKMASYGNYLFFRAGDSANGAQTTLKGEPLRSLKDGNKMVCKELKLVAANNSGEGQYIEAQGPGQIDILDTRNLDKDSPTYPTHLLWRDKLIVVKDKEGAQTFDLMKVYGNASFIDEIQKQELHGDQVYVWLRNPQDNEKKPQVDGNSGQELHRVLAQGHVRARSPQANITETYRLTMTFIPELASNERLPDPARLGDGKPAAGKNGPPTLPGPSAEPAKTPATTVKQPEKKPAAPIDLRANEVTIAVATLGTTKQLQEMVGKGNVFVFQAGDKPGEKRVEIQGQLLTLRHAEKGDTLIVHGDQQKKAYLELGEMKLWGPMVTVNQADNRADVDGDGAMEMPSTTNLDGTKSKKGPKRIIIHWKKNMTFDGKEADFHGGVMAFENGSHSRVLCENMTAILDRVISFKEGQKEGDKDGAKIERMLLDKGVYIDDVQIDDMKQLVQRSILQGQELFMDNLAGPTRVSGPGRVRLLAQGSSDVAAAPPPPAPPGQQKLAQPRPNWQQTRIDFPLRMFSDTKANIKNAKFWGEASKFVEVFHFPTVKIEENMDPDHPPKDGFYLRCVVLSVDGEQVGNKTTQNMIAERNVYFKSDKYVGYCDILRYNERTQIITLEGINGNIVRMYEVTPTDPRPMNFNSSKILYNRKTGEAISGNVKSITN